jgi:hypothetical protein
MKTIIVIGPPGAGKTTAVQLATEPWGQPEESSDPLPHLIYRNGAIQLGKHRPPFSGTDTLAMGINTRACAWIATKPAPLVICEGDRLANARFIDAAANAGAVKVLWLDLPYEVARQRALARSATYEMAPQTEPWARGRYTKVRNLAMQFPHVRLDATQLPAAIAATLAEHMTV